jgi:hypothetical protein
MKGQREGLSESNILTTKRCQGRGLAPQGAQVPEAEPVPAAHPATPAPTPSPPLSAQASPECAISPELEAICLTDTEEDVLPSEEGFTNAPKKTFTGLKLHRHRLQLTGRPQIHCAADSVHFSTLSSLVFTFMLLQDLVEDSDGGFVSATLQCCVCANAGTLAGKYHVNKKTMKSTGSILYHFHTNHQDWWATAEAADNSVAPHQKNTGTGKPIEVSINS